MNKIDKNLTSIFLVFFSSVIVALGQPAWVPFIAFFAASMGYALFWLTLYRQLSARRRFFLGAGWFFFIQLFQLHWLTSHPYSYIYIVYILLSFLFACQFGLLSVLVTEKLIKKKSTCFAIAGFWAFLEWIRLYFFIGFTFNPVGLSLAGNLYTMQAASVVGVLGLSYLVVLWNAFFLRAIIKGGGRYWTCWVAVFFCIFGFGFFQLHLKDAVAEEKISVLVVDTTFPAEEIHIRDFSELIATAQKEWFALLQHLLPYRGEKIDLIVFPEGAVPLGAKHAFYDYDLLAHRLQQEFGGDVFQQFPGVSSPFMRKGEGPSRFRLFVSNGFWAQGIASLLQSDLLIGLEGEKLEKDGVFATNAALLYRKELSSNTGWQNSYAKRVLFPLAEARPHPWLVSMAEKYGVSGGYVPGDHAQVMECNGTLFGVSVCYEETFSSIVRENSLLGAQFLVNLSNDVWYPRSKLARQHYELGRLRAVELGMAAVRSCNFGVSGAIDSKGRNLGKMEGNQFADWTCRVMKLDIPIQPLEDTTFYAKWGDTLMIVISLLGFLSWVFFSDLGNDTVAS